MKSGSYGEGSCTNRMNDGDAGKTKPNEGKDDENNEDEKEAYMQCRWHSNCQHQD